MRTFKRRCLVADLKRLREAMSQGATGDSLVDAKLRSIQGALTDSKDNTTQFDQNKVECLIALIYRVAKEASTRANSLIAKLAEDTMQSVDDYALSNQLFQGKTNWNLRCISDPCPECRKIM